MRSGLSAILMAVVGLAACGEAEKSSGGGFQPFTVTAPPPPDFIVEASEYPEGLRAIAYADDTVSSVHPTLTVTCPVRGEPFVFVEIGAEPGTPPPLADVYAELEVDDQGPIRFEFSWLEDDKWTPRNRYEGRAQDAYFVRTILRGQMVRLTIPALYGGRGPMTWDLSRFGERLPDVQRACAQGG